MLAPSVLALWHACSHLLPITEMPSRIQADSEDIFTNAAGSVASSGAFAGMSYVKPSIIFMFYWLSWLFDCSVEHHVWCVTERGWNPT